ncbi:MAG: terminase small subunit [Desulfamplus sp.]|nr:terminase small subunit [Desulfamplus sp.]
MRASASLEHQINMNKSMIPKTGNKSSSKALSKRQLKFIDLYDGNAEQTAIKAGYSVKYAKRAGIRNLKNDTLRHLLEEKRQAEIKPEVMNRIQRQVFWSDIIRDESLSIRDRLRASELLGRSEGDFLERMDLSGETTTKIKITRLNIAWEGERDRLVETDIENI